MSTFLPFSLTDECISYITLNVMYSLFGQICNGDNISFLFASILPKLFISLPPSPLERSKAEEDGKRFNRAKLKK